MENIIINLSEEIKSDEYTQINAPEGEENSDKKAETTSLENK